LKSKIFFSKFSLEIQHYQRRKYGSSLMNNGNKILKIRDCWLNFSNCLIIIIRWKFLLTRKLNYFIKDFKISRSNLFKKLCNVNNFSTLKYEEFEMLWDIWNVISKRTKVDWIFLEDWR
jgi:hypothetical protein